MKKQIILISGASSGIGYAIAKVLALNENNVIIMSGKNSARLANLADGLARVSPACIDSFVADVTKEKQIDKVVSQIINKYGSIDTLIMSAGVSIHGFFGELFVRDFDEVMDVNLRGRYLMAKAVWPFLLEKGHGRIINISSSSGLSNYKSGSIYCAANAGVNSLINSMALEGQEIGIKVSNVILGQVDTPIWNLNDEVVNSARKGMLTAEGVASYVEYILSRPANEHHRSIVLHPFAMQPILLGRNRGPGGKFPHIDDKGESVGKDSQFFRI